MPVAISNCYVIEKAIKDLLCDDNTPMKFKAIDVQSNISALSRPGLACAVMSGDFTEADFSGRIEENAKIVVSLVFKNVASEEERRKIAHPAVSYVIGKLHNNDVGLDMKPLSVARWRDVTTAEHLTVACMVVEIEFTTQFTVTPESAEHNYRELLSIGTTFKIEGHDYEMIIHGDAVVKEPKVKILELEDGYIFKLENDKFLILENDDS